MRDIYSICFSLRVYLPAVVTFSRAFGANSLWNGTGLVLVIERTESAALCGIAIACIIYGRINIIAIGAFIAIIAIFFLTLDRICSSISHTFIASIAEMNGGGIDC